MMARAVLFAAFVACASADGTLTLPCGTCGDCCLPGWFIEADTCVNQADPSTWCVLCSDNSQNPCGDGGFVATTDLISAVGKGALPGSTTGGGHSVGSRLSNPQKGFVDILLPNSVFNYYRDWQVGAQSTRYETSVGDDLAVYYNCETARFRYPQVAACDFYFFVYRCHNCKSTNSGALHAYLISQGWKVHGCGPKFTLAKDKTEHPMITYHKESIEDEVVAPGVELNFVHTAVGYKTKLCSAIDNASDCADADSCVWDANALNTAGNYGECTTGWCPKNPYAGPSLGCPVCPLKDNGDLNFD